MDRRHVGQFTIEKKAIAFVHLSFLAPNRSLDQIDLLDAGAALNQFQSRVPERTHRKTQRSKRHVVHQT